MADSTPMIARRALSLNVTLWVAQLLLALAFGMAGVMKAFMPMPELVVKIFWASDVPVMLTRFIGVSELAAAIGMILPAATRIYPRLTGWAGVGLTTVMILAIGFHLVRGEAQFIIGPVILGVLSAFVAWGRLKKAPFTARS